MPNDIGFYENIQREAELHLNDLLERPMPADEFDCANSEMFDPWDLFPSVYGSYSAEFDMMAIEVLSDIQAGRVGRVDLAAEMFREMLCTAGHCGYGTSPRTCYPTQRFRMQLPTLIEKWKAYAKAMWE